MFFLDIYGQQKYIETGKTETIELVDPARLGIMIEGKVKDVALARLITTYFGLKIQRAWRKYKARKT